MPISGCHNLPLATFNLPSRNNPQNKRQQRPASSVSFPISALHFPLACLIINP